MIQQTIDVLKKFEGFSSRAYWDVNAYRIGYGSDTITSANGTYRKVKQGDTISQAQADLDLARRIPEFEKVIIKQVGAEAWDKLPDQAKAGLISFAYNYGSIAKKSLRTAIVGGNLNEIADTLISSTLNDNAKLSAGTRDALKARRKYEAELIRTAQPNILKAGINIKQVAGIFLLAVAFTFIQNKLKK
jgi:GH24 family phage-related lysozyme (muramidase)